MKVKITYIADDGKEFKTATACKEYEQLKTERNRKILTDIEAYDATGFKLDLTENDWFDYAFTIVIKTKEAAEAFAHILANEESAEEFYTCYMPDFAEGIRHDIVDMPAGVPLVYGYVSDSFWSADDPNAYVHIGFYNLNKLLHNFRFGVNVLCEADTSLKREV